MIFAIDEHQRRVRASPKGIGYCSGCGRKLVPKCGSLVAHHWAHKAGDCDPWFEGETAWHLWWKSRAPDDWCEVAVGTHRADIRRPDGLVIELQRSSISPEEIAERERFYGSMVWIVDVRGYKGPIWVYDTAQENVEVRWDPRFPRPWRDTQCRLYLDLGPSIFEVVDHLGRHGHARGFAKPRRALLSALGLDAHSPIESDPFGVWLMIHDSTARFFPSRFAADTWTWRNAAQRLVLGNGTTVEGT